MLILVTSAELNLMKEMRSVEYKKTIDWMNQNVTNHNVVWLECISNREPPYLNKSFPCYCPNVHNSHYQNKGSNLGNSLKSFFDNCEVDDNLIVQMTGRYHFMDTYFFEQIEKNPGYDLYAKNDGYDQYFTGCFALKTQYFIEWVSETDWDYLNYVMMNIEKSLWNFSRRKKLHCYEVDSMHMECNIFGTGNLTKAVV